VKGSIITAPLCKQSSAKATDRPLLGHVRHCNLVVAATPVHRGKGGGHTCPGSFPASSLPGGPSQLAAAEHVDVQVIDTLAPITSVVNHGAEAALRQALLPGHLLRGEQEVAQQRLLVLPCI